MQVVLESERVRAQIDPNRGARLTSLRFDGIEVLGQADDVNQVGESLGSGSYPMVPWAGRVRGMKMHGTGRDAQWNHHGDGRFQVELGDSWPDTGVATLDHRVTEDSLQLTLEWSASPDTSGCSLGFHPWFRRVVDGVEVVADVVPTVMVERGADHLPTGRIIAPSARPWDDCFQLARPATLTWPGLLALELSSDAAWWVVFTEPIGAICVEPQTAPPDAWNHPALRPQVWPTRVTFEIRAV